MVLSIARQSVVIKCNLKSSIMTGNYEFYYAAGVLYQLEHIEPTEALEPKALETELQRLLENFESADEREQHLAHMLKYYKPVEKFDDQMKELFWNGYTDRYLWQELVPQE